MKSLIKHKPFLEIFLFILPFVLWIFCFRHFFTGRLCVEADAVSYQDNILFYINNLSRGIYPLWDPHWYGGAPYEFFLRRMGDVNPFLWVIICLKWCGIAETPAYCAFLGLYYLLAVLGFYLIARLLFKERLYAFIAYILLLFSSWGSEIFYNYIIIIFVPIVWFFYFLLRFAVHAKKSFFLGMSFCLGLIVTTYIPFFFLTILVLFIFFFAVFYFRSLPDILRRFFLFARSHKIFTVLCLFFVLLSCVPSVNFYKESKKNEFVMPNRHSGAQASSQVAVGIENAASGDIINHGYFDRLFDDQARLVMGDIYIPYFFFLLLLTTAFARSSRLIYFLLFNILAISLVTVTSVAGIHRFLYQHLFIFKFIRNIYYFFWLAMLPMIVLLAADTFRSLHRTIEGSSKKAAWLVYVIGVHVLFAIFLLTRHGVMAGAWLAVALSLVFFILVFFCRGKIVYLAGCALVLAGAFVQSSQIYARLNDNLFKYQYQITHFVQTHANSKPVKWELYYASPWIALLNNYIDPSVFFDYIGHKFILYDNAVPYVESPQFLKIFESTLNANDNIAYVPKLESTQDQWKNNGRGPADFNPLGTGRLEVAYADVNTLKLKTHLDHSQFLVINDSYNSGWHALINGQAARLLRANVAFKGLWVPAGDSTIVLRFATPQRYLFHYVLIGLYMAVFLCLLVLLKKEAEWSA